MWTGIYGEIGLEIGLIVSSTTMRLRSDEMNADLSVCRTIQMIEQYKYTKNRIRSVLRTNTASHEVFFAVKDDGFISKHQFGPSWHCLWLRDSFVDICSWGSRCGLVIGGHFGIDTSLKRKTTREEIWEDNGEIRSENGRGWINRTIDL